MNSSPTTKLFIVYDSLHIGEAAVRVARGETIVCFDYFVGQQLEQGGIPHLSPKNLIDKTDDEGEWWKLALDIAREWYRVPAMNFFTYNNIRLAEAVEQIVLEYLLRLFYYVRMYQVLKKKYVHAYVDIPTPRVNNAPDAYCLALFMPWAIVDAAIMAGLEVSQTRPPTSPLTLPRPTWKEFMIRVYNALIGTSAPRRRFTVYTSEYRTHFAPVIPHLQDTEIMLWESRGLFDLPLRTMVKHRIRVFGSGRGVSAHEEKSARAAARAFAGEWEVAKQKVKEYLTTMRADLEWSPVLEMSEYLMAYAPRVIADINAFTRIMREEKPDVVLQMAAGPHYHFFLMGTIATECKIPSIELQHASGMIDPRYCRVATDYVATFGEDVNAWHERIGRSPTQLFAVGSPRFDHDVNDRAHAHERGKKLFASLGLDSSRPTLFVAVPFSDTLLVSPDSYELATFFQTIREVQRQVPGLQIVFKFRSSRHVGKAREYLSSLFTGDYAIAGDENVFDLISASSFALCNNSTVIYEILIAKRPLTLYPWKRFDSYHAAMYQAAAPLCYDAPNAVDSIAQMCTDPAYQAKLLEKQTKFLEGYSFDGHSSERLASLLHTLAEKSRVRN